MVNELKSLDCSIEETRTRLKELIAIREEKFRAQNVVVGTRIQFSLRRRGVKPQSFEGVVGDVRDHAALGKQYYVYVNRPDGFGTDGHIVNASQVITVYAAVPAEGETDTPVDDALTS
jgi:hypothetical protein